MYNVKLSKFEGPLDLLLRLIEEQKLDIAEVSLAKVADDYLEYVRNDKNISLEHLSEFISIAAKIILIKSRNILPTLEVTPEEEKEIKDLEEQLKLYREYKEISGKIGSLLKKNVFAYSRDYLLGIANVFSPPKNVNLFDLKKCYNEVVAQIILPEKIPEEAVRDIFTLEDKISELQKTLMERIEISFSDLKASAKDKIEVIVSFLALLEMIKQRIITAEQRELFEDIRISKFSSQDNQIGTSKTEAFV
jgi:segregation and condensation protein A